MDTKSVPWQPGVLSRGYQLSDGVPKIIFFILFSEGTVTNPAFWLVVSAGKILLYLPTGHGNAFVRFCPCVYKNWNSIFVRKEINKLFTGLGSVRIVKNCDLGLENAAHGLRPRAAFSRPRSQFFTIRTSQPANNIDFFYPFFNPLKTSLKFIFTPALRRLSVMFFF